MNFLKKTLGLFLILAVLLCVLPANAEASEIVASGTTGDLEWVIDGDGVLTISGEGSIPDYSYSYYYGTYAPWGNYESYVTSVQIHPGVTAIGDYAFYDMSYVTEVSLPNTLTTVGYSAFKYTDLTSVTIPASVTYLEGYAFAYNYDLCVITFEGTAPSLGTYPFYNASSYTVVNYPRGDSSYSSIMSYSYMGVTATWNAHGPLYAPVVTVSSNAATGKPVLTWDAVDEAVKYKAYVSTSKNGTYKLLTTTDKTTATHTKAVAGQLYYYKVMAIAEDSENNSEYSTLVKRTCDLPAPSISVKNDASTGACVISWKPVDDAIAYTVQCSTTGTDGWKNIKSQCTDLTVTHSKGEAGTAYYYRVKALFVDDAADSAYSKVVKRVRDCKTPTVTVTNDTASGKPVIAWKSVSGAVKYKVYRATDKNGDYSLKKTVTDGTSWTDTKAVAGQIYYYKVTAVPENSSGTSGYSAAVKKCCDCKQPTLKISSSSLTSIKISWKSVSGAEKYAIYRSTKSGSGFKKIYTSSGTSYTDKNITKGKTYYYKIMALAENSGGNSAYSAVVGARASIAAPTMKSSATATSSTIKISWSEVSGASGYYVYRRASEDDSWTKVKTVKSGSTTSFTDKERSGRYYYCVASYKVSGGTTYTSIKSDPIRVRTLSKPSSVTTEGGSGLTIDVSWNNVSGATGYQVYYKVTKEGSWQKADVVTSLSYNHSIDHGKYYYYKVRAIYEYEGTTSYGEFRETENGRMKYYNPKVTTYMSSTTDSSNSVFLIYIKNNGVAPIYFYADGARSVDRDYDSYNRNLIMYDYDYYDTYGSFKTTDCTVVQPGESTYLLLCSSTSTWYDKYTRVVLKCYYDGVWYNTYTSSYYGFYYYEQ